MTSRDCVAQSVIVHLRDIRSGWSICGAILIEWNMKQSIEENMKQQIFVLLILALLCFGSAVFLSLLLP